MTAKSGGSKKALKEDLLEDVNVIWPSVAMIGQSVNGYDSGAVIICQAKTIRQEDAAKKMLLPNTYKPTIEQVMRKWQGEPGHKERRAPHIKTFYRYFISVEDGRPELCWLYLGSHEHALGSHEHGCLGYVGNKQHPVVFTVRITSSVCCFCPRR